MSRPTFRMVEISGRISSCLVPRMRRPLVPLTREQLRRIVAGAAITGDVKPGLARRLIKRIFWGK